VANIIDSIAHLLGALVWPALIGFIILRFGPKLAPNISALIGSLSEMSFKGAGIDLTLKTNVAANLAAAGIAREDAAASPEAQIDHVKEATQIVEEITPNTFRRARGARVLWVDDRPGNNVLERRSLEALGLNFVLSLSTDDALEKLKAEPFDVIISDMGRPPDTRAGYTLLDKLRAAGNHTPFIIYAGSRSPEHQAEARQHGAMGSTNRPTELFELVLEALNQQRS
jgi:CheY-like chemotaxis protein